MFMVKLVAGEIDSSYLLSQINFSIPARYTRNYVPLSLNLCTNNYSLHEPFRVLCTDYNKLYNVFNADASTFIIKTSILFSLTHNN